MSRAREQTICIGTPFRDMIYAPVVCSWLSLWPRPDRWVYQLDHHLPESHNLIVEHFLDTDCDRLLILEDDMWPHPEVVARCRGHKADAVSGVYRGRHSPYPPMVFDKSDKNGVEVTFYPFRLQQRLDKPREYPIEVAGTGIMSIHRRVLEAMPPPWFEIPPPMEGLTGPDFYFCMKLRRAGFSLAVDTHEHMKAQHVGWRAIPVGNCLLG